MIASGLLFNSILASATMMSGEETCAWHKQLYPKEAVQFPTPFSGRVEKACEWTCGELTFDQQNDTNQCKYDCGTDGDAMTFITATGFTLTNNSACNTKGNNTGLLQKVARINAFAGTGAGTGIEIEVNVENTSCVLKPTIQDVKPDRAPYPTAAYETWDSNESFKLDWDATNKKFTINAKEMFGVYHAMSTIENMIEGVSKAAFDAAVLGNHHRMKDLRQGNDIVYGIPFDDFSMTDMPKYPYRGILIDTARSYLPVAKLKEVIDLMSISKMNVMHWHATDDQSFPLALGSRRAFTSATASTPSAWNTETIKGKNVTDWIHGDGCNTSIIAGNASCAATMAPGAHYDRTDIADVYTYAWMKGINVLMEIDSPSHARSWAMGQLDSCEAQKWDGNVNPFYGNSCPTELANRDGPDSALGIMCHGMKYQQDEYCMQQLCGPLNIRMTEESYAEGATEFGFVNQFPIDTFKGLTASLDQLVDEELTSVEWINGYAAQDLDGFKGKKFIDAGENFHIGIDEALPTCLDGIGGGNAMTSASIGVWIDEIMKDVVARGWVPHAWHDALGHYPELQDSMVENGFVPQFWQQAVDSTWEIMEWANNGFVWSPNETAYLDCGLGNNAVAGFDSYCRPWKNFWHTYNLDPEMHTGFATANENRVAAGNDLIRAKGNEVCLWGELGTVQNVIPRAFPRASAAAGAAWSGRDRIPPFDNNINVLETFDFSSIDSKDFEDEYEWVAFGYNMAHSCHEIMPEKTVFCSMNPGIQDHFCKHFGKAVYDTEATRTPPPPEPTPEGGDFDIEKAMQDQQEALDIQLKAINDVNSSVGGSSGIATAGMVFALLAFLAASAAAFFAMKAKKNTKVLSSANVAYVDI